MMREPGPKEDAKNLGLVGGSAIVAVLVTVGLLFATPKEETVVTVRVITPEPVVDVEPVVVVEEEPEVVEPTVVRTPLTGANRLYGDVITVDGRLHTGYIRWDRNEGSWTDLLDANKRNRRGRSSVSGIRFGHVDQIHVLGNSSARFTLRSGEEVDFNARATDLGSGLRALVVDDGEGIRETFDWHDLEVIDFVPPPPSKRPSESRLYGTLTTRAGMDFTGYITWDVDEIYTTDVLDGDLSGERMKIPFGTIESIERFSPRAALVVLQSGEELILDGTNDVDRSIGGISVSDTRLGQVKMGWDEFDRVVFHGTDDEAELVQFDGGSRIVGTVVTDRGQELTGQILWDMDQAYTWEMLTGEIDDVELKIEFGEIETIERRNRGATVTLRDGRVFDLSDTRDVGHDNRGIVIDDGDVSYEVEWDDFRELRINR